MDSSAPPPHLSQKGRGIIQRLLLASGFQPDHDRGQHSGEAAAQAFPWTSMETSPSVPVPLAAEFPVSSG